MAKARSWRLISNITPATPNQTKVADAHVVGKVTVAWKEEIWLSKKFSKTEAGTDNVTSPESAVIFIWAVVKKFI